MATIGPSISFSSVGPSGAPDIAYSNFYVAIQSPWGIDNAWQICSSFGDFLKLYGGLNKLASVASGTTADTFTTETDDDVVQAYYAVKGYFENKGQNSPGVLFVNRVIASSSGPTAATKTFADFAGTNNTTVTSKWKGIHGATTQITMINPSPRKGILTLQTGTVSVTSGSAAVTGVGTSFATGATWEGYGIQIGTEYYTILSVTNTTSLTLTANATTTWSGAAFKVGAANSAFYMKAYHPQSGILEEWDISSSADAADVSKRSQLVTVTLPAGGQFPVTASASKLNSGTPPTADSYAATDSDYVGTTSAAGVKTGLQVFNDQRLGTGLVAIPGKTSSTVRTGIKSHCENYYRFGLYGPAASLTLTTAATEFASTASNFGAGWVPRLVVPSDSSTTGGGVTVDNVGHLAGLFARMDRDYGAPHKSAAGVTHQLLNVLDVESQSSGMEIFDDAGSNTLADYNTNTLRRKAGGIVSWGLRSLASDERYRQQQVGRLVCLVYLSCFQLMEKRTFEPIDSFGRLFSAIKGDLDAFFFSLWRRGALYGGQPGADPSSKDAWRVVCDVGNNPNVEIGKGNVTANVSFVPVLNAERITLPIQVAAPGFGSAAASSF
jgi:phage tail sheath protein FI